MGFRDLPLDTRYHIIYVCGIWGFLVMSWSIVLSCAPLILKDIVGSSEAAEWMGTFTATTAVAGIVLCSLIGYSSDRMGRMLLIVPSLIAFFCSATLVLYADVERTVMPMWLARFAPLSVPSTLIFALISDLVSGSHVVEAHGYLGATFGVAAMIGAGGCGIITRHVSRPAALCMAVLSAGVSAFLSGFSPKALKSSSKVTQHESLIAAAKHISKNDPLLRSLIIAFSLLKVGNINSSFMFTLYANYRYGWDVLDCALLIGMVGAVGVVLQFFGIPYVLKRQENITPYLIFSVAALPVTMVGYGFSVTTTGLWFWAFVGSVISVAIALFTSKITILGAEDGLAGTAIGLVGTTQNIIEAVSAIIFGQILKWTLANYGPTDILTGIPYFANTVPYLLSLAFLMHGHIVYGKNRLAWISHVDMPKSPITDP